MSEEEKVLDALAETLFKDLIWAWTDAYPKNASISEKKAFFRRFWVAERD